MISSKIPISAVAGFKVETYTHNSAIADADSACSNTNDSRSILDFFSSFHLKHLLN